MKSLISCWRRQLLMLLVVSLRSCWRRWWRWYSCWRRWNQCKIFIFCNLVSSGIAQILYFWMLLVDDWWLLVDGLSMIVHSCCVVVLVVCCWSCWRRWWMGSLDRMSASWSSCQDPAALCSRDDDGDDGVRVMTIKMMKMVMKYVFWRKIYVLLLIGEVVRLKLVGSL